MRPNRCRVEGCGQTRMRWGYRFRQLLMRRRADDAAVARETAQRALPRAAYRLFEEMSAGDQIHALCVFRAVGMARTPPADLAQAALLHDVGKAAGRLTIPYRAMIVLLEWVGGGLLKRLSLAEPTSWRYPFHIHLNHAELGALRCGEAGCSRLAVALVRYHELPLKDAPHDRGLRESLIALKKADESC